MNAYPRLAAESAWNRAAPGRLPAAIEDGGRQTLVALNEHRTGAPVFLVPALYPSPWMFLPLVEAMDLGRPVYGLRSPELDWPHHMLPFHALASLYTTAIRQVTRGPFTLVGYSFGGVMAFEIATHAATAGEVTHLILLDTAPPSDPPSPGIWFRGHVRDGIRTLLVLLASKDLIGARALSWFGVRSPLARVDFALGVDKLRQGELRLCLRLLDPTTTPDAGASLERFGAMVVETLKSIAPFEWAAAEQLLRHTADDPLTAIRGYKLMKKNGVLRSRYRPRIRFPGRMTIYVSAENQSSAQWQRHCERTVTIRRVAATGCDGRSVHLSFLDEPNVRLYADELKHLLCRRGGPGVRRITDLVQTAPNRSYRLRQCHALVEVGPLIVLRAHGSREHKAPVPKRLVPLRCLEERLDDQWLVLRVHRRIEPPDVQELLHFRQHCLRGAFRLFNLGAPNGRSQHGESLRRHTPAQLRVTLRELGIVQDQVVRRDRV
jgi:pimeloyl-ACP methyl ester carboxylesterase